MSRSWIGTKMEFVLTKGYIMTLYFLASVHISVHCISKDLIFIEKIHLHSFSTI